MQYKNFLIVTLLIILVAQPATALERTHIVHWATHGDAPAQFELGTRYYFGHGLPQSYERAARWFRKAARKNAATQRYIEGNHFDKETAVDVLRRGAERGSPQAQYELGNRYFFGRSIDRNFQQAATWYRRAALHGFPGGKWAPKMKITAETGGSPSKLQTAKETIQELRKAAAKGDYNTQYYLDARDRYRGSPPMRSYSTGNLPPYSSPYPTATPYVNPYSYSPPGSLLDAAKAGNLSAQYQIAMRYLHRNGVLPNFTEAARWLRKVALKHQALWYSSAPQQKIPTSIALKDLKKQAEAGNPAAQYQMGNRYYLGIGTHRNFQLAAQWYDQAILEIASHYHSNSPMINTRVNIQKRWSDMSPSEREFWIRHEVRQPIMPYTRVAPSPLPPIYTGSTHTFERDMARAAQAGDMQAIHIMEQGLPNYRRWNPDQLWAPAYLPTHNLNWRYDYSAIRIAAEAGNADAQFQLGTRYYFANGVTRNRTEAARWFRLASLQGHGPARYYLELMQANHEDLQALRASAETGDSTAQFHMGAAYFYGLSVPQDFDQAELWYRKAAINGNARAQFRLGLLLSNKKKDKEAESWLRKSAMQGYIPAQFNLAAYLETGRRGNRKIKEALRWYRCVAEKGSILAHGLLASMYLDGRGTKRNISAAGTCKTRASLQNLLTGFIDQQIIVEEFLEGGNAPVCSCAWLAYLQNIGKLPQITGLPELRSLIQNRLSKTDKLKADKLAKQFQAELGN